MMVSTKGRYALRVMIDLAMHSDDGRVSLSDISKRQKISLKYLENITSILVKAGYVDGTRGRGGGYVLTKPTAEYSVSEILKLTEGTLAPVACLGTDHNECMMASECITLPMWTRLDSLIEGYLSSVTLADLIEGRVITNQIN